MQPSIVSVLNADTADAEEVGLQGTPTFFVNGKPLTNFSPEGLKALIQAESTCNRSIVMIARRLFLFGGAIAAAFSVLPADALPKKKIKPKFVLSRNSSHRWSTIPATQLVR